MAVKVNLRHLEDKNLQLEGEVPPAEMDLDTKDEVIRVVKPLRFELEVQLLEESLLVQGNLSLPLSCDCVRCLRPFEHTVRLDPWSLHVPLTGEEAAPVANDLVDLTPYLREDILLNLPQHPLCGSECGGLPETKTGKDKPQRNPGEKDAASSAWGELNKLKL